MGGVGFFCFWVGSGDIEISKIIDRKYSINCLSKNWMIDLFS
jgi:hypothetical protein